MTELININNTAIDIGICTFRRPHVTETIRSVSKLSLRPGWKVNIIVVDNDVVPSAVSAVEAVAGEIPMDVTYVHAPAGNISIARNACLEAATAPLVAFVDDDELVTPGWLGAMMDTLKQTGADVVLGPVNAVYDSACPQWVRKGDFHSTRPVFVDGKIRTGYTGNVLMRRLALPLMGLRFRQELGKTGGEDTAFFSSVTRAGGTIGYAPDALIIEGVAPQRTTMKWLMKRYFQGGYTHGILVMEQSGTSVGNRIHDIGKAFAKVVFCLCMAVPNVFHPERMAHWLLRGTMHAGAVSALASSSRSALHSLVS